MAPEAFMPEEIERWELIVRVSGMQVE